MSDIFENIGRQAQGNNACYVAYTLNNAQPVRCTIIGDEPLFYMDYECDYEDSDIFDAAELKILETEIKNLQKQINSRESLPADLMAPKEDRQEMFSLDAGCVTQEFQGENADINALLDALSESRMAKAYIDFADEHRIEMKFSAQITDGFYDREAGTIFINSNLVFAEQLLLAARELRRHWQHRQGALIHPLMFHPDNAVLINRVQVADLVVAMIRIGWELQLSGHKEVWQRIEQSSMADIAQAFAREAFADFRTLNNGDASAAIFESWFLSERCREEDKNLIQQMLADYQGYVFDPEEAEKTITPTLIAALGEMPYGKNYLSAHTVAIMEDPIFTDVRDRSNANFLWFIKFEKSFRETEQELQGLPEQAAEDVRHSAFQFEKQDQDHETRQQVAEVISLNTDSVREEPRDESSGRLLKQKPRGKKSDNTGADIIYLRRWSGE